MAIENRQEFLDVLARIKGGRKAQGQDYAKGAAAAEIGRTVAASFANVASTVTDSIETTGSTTQLELRNVREEIREGTDDPETRRESARAQRLREIKERTKEKKEDVLMRKESFFGKTLGGIKGLFAGLGAIAKVFASAGGFLLKPLKWLGGLGKVLKIARALFIGIGGIFLAFTGLTLAGAMMKPEDYEKLKKQIAGGVATVAKNLVGWAMDIWNEFAPEGLQISDADKKKYKEGAFKTVNDSILAIMKFADDLSAAFGTGFGTEWTGIKEKFADFKTAWTDVFNQLKEKSPDGKETLFSVVNWLGKAFGKFVKGLLTIGTLLANLITDPRVTLAKLQVKVESFFGGIMDSISRLFDKFFNMDFILRLLPESLQTAAREMGFMKSAANIRGRKKLAEMAELDTEKERLKNSLEANKINLAAANKEHEAIRVLQRAGKKVNEARIEANTTERVKWETDKARTETAIERNIENHKAATEAFDLAQKHWIDERQNQLLEELTGKDRIKIETEIQANTEKREEIIEEGVEEGMKGTLQQAQKINKVLQKLGIDAGRGLRDSDRRAQGAHPDGTPIMIQEGYFKQVKMTARLQVALLDSAAGIGLTGRQIEMMADDPKLLSHFLHDARIQLTKIAKIDAVNLELKGVIADAITPELLTSTKAQAKQEAMDRLSAQQSFQTKKDDDIVASYLPSSGVVLQQLATRTTQGGTALSYSDDHSAVVNNFNQTTIVPPQPRYLHPLWGEQTAVA